MLHPAYPFIQGVNADLDQVCPQILQILNEKFKVFSQKLKKSMCVYEGKGEIVINKVFFFLDIFTFICILYIFQCM